MIAKSKPVSPAPQSTHPRRPADMVKLGTAPYAYRVICTHLYAMAQRLARAEQLRELPDAGPEVLGAAINFGVLKTGRAVLFGVIPELASQQAEFHAEDGRGPIPFCDCDANDRVRVGCKAPVIPAVALALATDPASLVLWANARLVDRLQAYAHGPVEPPRVGSKRAPRAKRSANTAEVASTPSTLSLGLVTP